MLEPYRDLNSATLNMVFLNMRLTPLRHTRNKTMDLERNEICTPVKQKCLGFDILICRYCSLSET